MVMKAVAYGWVCQYPTETRSQIGSNWACAIILILMYKAVQSHTSMHDVKKLHEPNSFTTRYTNYTTTESYNYWYWYA